MISIHTRRRPRATKLSAPTSKRGLISKLVGSGSWGEVQAVIREGFSTFGGGRSYLEIACSTVRLADRHLQQLSLLALRGAGDNFATGWCCQSVDFAGEQRTEPVSPVLDALVADVDVALSQKILHVALRSRLSDVHQHDGPDQQRRAVETSKRVV